MTDECNIAVCSGNPSRDSQVTFGSEITHVVFDVSRLAAKLRSYGWITDADVYEELISVNDGEVTAHHDALDRWAQSIRDKLAAS